MVKVFLICKKNICLRQDVSLILPNSSSNFIHTLIFIENKTNEMVSVFFNRKRVSFIGNLI